MADDTRLAEASLLLNYSNQSYKEQLLVKMEQQQQDQQQEVPENAAEVKKSSTATLEPDENLITPPPENEFTVFNMPPLLELKVVGRNYNDETILNNEFTCPPELERIPSLAEHETAENVVIKREPTSSVGSNIGVEQNMDSSHNRTEAIQNLLAAVNCALPSNHRNRPIILQRPSVTTQIYPARIHSDHDYCQQNSENNKTGQDCVFRENQLNKQKQQFTSFSGPKRKSNLLLSTKLSSTSSSSSSSSCSSYSYSSSGNKSITAKPLKVVAIHLGAGNSSRHDADAMQLAKTICEEIMYQSTYHSEIHPLTTKQTKKRKQTITSDYKLYGKNQERSLNGEEHENMTAEMAVVQLIKRMEDNHNLNCGYGSNLNMKGQVECDASLMCDRTMMWSGVGAISGCKNPIMLAKSLYDYRLVPRPLGLIQPNLLVGSGAKQWMREHCPHLSIMDSKLICSRAFTTYQKLKSRYDSLVRLRPSSKQETTTAARLSREPTTKQAKDPKVGLETDTSPLQLLDHGFYCAKTKDNLKKASPFARPIFKQEPGRSIYSQPREIDIPSVGDHSYNGRPLETNTVFLGATTTGKPNNSDDVDDTTIGSHRLDTVGAIAVDCDNNFASAISSGGLLLKFKGRLGQAAVPGAGCWSEDSVAVTTTGVGEYLTCNLFAKKFYDKMVTLRLLYDLGHVDKNQLDSSSLISCGMEECFEDLMRSTVLDHVAPENRSAGMLSVSSLNSKDSPNRVDENDLYLSFAHNTNSMCVGYMTCNDIVAHSIMSHKPPSAEGEKQEEEEEEEEVGEEERTATRTSAKTTTIVQTIKLSSGQGI